LGWNLEILGFLTEYFFLAGQQMGLDDVPEKETKEDGQDYG
jgi:hypothetical protein